MANEFIARKGLIAYGQISGSGNLLIAGNGTVGGNLTIGGTLSAQEFYTELVSSSVIYESGSTKFGDTPDDNHFRTGSMFITGSTSVTGSVGIYKSGSTVLDIQGSQGQLFSITDSLTGTLMSVNDISGLPILEVSDDDKVVMGTFGANTLVVTGSNVGIGTDTPSIKLEVSGSLGAPNFTTGFGGTSWRLGYTPASSSLEIDSLTVRGTLKVFELLINQIRATNGNLFVSSVGKVDTVGGTAPNFTLTFDTGSGGILGHGFRAGDLIRAQRVNPSATPGTFIYRSDATVTSVSANGKDVNITMVAGEIPAPGYEYVRLGNTTTGSRQGTVYLTADDENAPYIDVVDGVTTHAEWNLSSGSNKLKTRMGKLDGITNTPFGSLSGYGFYASGSAYLIGGINATTGNIGGFAITKDAITGSGFYISGGAASNGFFISSSGFNVKGSGNITASAGLVGGWNLSTTSLSQGNVNLLATAVSGGLFVTSGSDRILTVGDFADIPISTSPGLFATASLFRSTTNGTVDILSSSNSLIVNRNTTTTNGQYVVTTITQSLGTIPAGRVIALEYNYADLTTYTASAATVTWNNTSPLGRVTDTVSSATTTQTGVITPITSSSTVSGVINGARGVVTLVVSSSFNQDTITSNRGIFYLTKGTLFLRDGSGNTLGTFNLQLPSTKGAIATTPVTASFNYASPTTIQFTGSYEWAIDPVEAGFETSFGVTSSLQIGDLASTLYIPAEFTASFSSSNGTQLLNTFKNTGSNDSQPYSRPYADSYFVPTAVTDAKLIFTVKQLGSGSAYTNLPSYKISDILLSTDLPKVNITRNQALFYNSPLQYMQWTTSSFDIRGDIDATSLTVRGTTNLLGPVNIEGDIAAHPDVQGASTTINTAGTVLQNLTFDLFGHTTGISTTNLDSRYQLVGSYVTTNTSQTISAEKNFSADISMSRGAGVPAVIAATGVTANDLVLESKGGGVILQAPNNGNVQLKDGSTVNVHVEGSTGRVGVGNTSPQAPLHVTGQISGSSVRAAHSSSNGAGGITQTVIIVDGLAITHTLTFTDGLLTAYSDA